MSEQNANLTGAQKQALQMAADCGWGVRTTDNVSLIEVPAHEGERRETLDAVFGLPMDGSGTHLPSGESVADLGLAYEQISVGFYLITHPARSEGDGYGFDEETGEMGSIESAEQLVVEGPLLAGEAVNEFYAATGEWIRAGLSR